MQMVSISPIWHSNKLANPEQVKGLNLHPNPTSSNKQKSENFQSRQPYIVVIVFGASWQVNTLLVFPFAFEPL